MSNTELTLVRHGDGDQVYLRGEAPPTIVISKDLLVDHDTRWMQVDGDEITFTLTNSTWHYRITSPVLAGVVTATKVSGHCCDMHNQHCEPPGDLCCRNCTEAAHDTFPIRHADGSRCVLDQRQEDTRG